MAGSEVTLERDLLLRMLNDSRYLALLPPLRTLKPQLQAKRKTSCCRSKTRGGSVSQNVIEDVKRQIANLLSGSSSLQQELRTLLNARTLRIKYVKADRTGSIVKKFS